MSYEKAESSKEELRDLQKVADPLFEWSNFKPSDFEDTFEDNLFLRQGAPLNPIVEEALIEKLGSSVSNLENIKEFLKQDMIKPVLKGIGRTEEDFIRDVSRYGLFPTIGYYVKHLDTQVDDSVLVKNIKSSSSES